jgi:TonB-linked SusC/RagA family outer membrane protein
MVQVTGMVTDSAQTPLLGVSVSIKNNPTTGTSTNAGGQYILAVPAGTTLVFSFVGFRDEERLVGDSASVINVMLSAKNANQDEVVVVAYGTQKKKEVVGSLSTVNVEDLKKVPTSNLTTALAGRVAGLIAYQRSGEPGQDNADFFIRGVTTFGYKKDPLILIDGVELTTTDLARLRPDDIASFSIMKDAASTSLYGARGANGVILVTTKRGKTGSAKIAANYETSISQPTQNLKLVNPVDYMRLYNEAVYTRNPLGNSTLYPEEKIENTANGVNPYVYPANDWLNLLFKKQAVNQRGNLNVSGGGSVARYFISTSFTQDNGILKVDRLNNFNNNINLKSYTLRSNVDVDLTKTTLVSVNLAGNFDDYNGPLQGGADVYSDIMHSNPVRFPAYFPVTPEYAYLKHTMFGNYLDDENSTAFYLNPYAEMVKGYKDDSRSFMSAQLEIKQNLNFWIKGLNFRTMANINRTSNFSLTRQYVPFWYSVAGYDKPGNSYRLVNLNANDGTEYLNYVPGDRKLEAAFYMESALNYNHTFGSKHNFGQMLIYILRNKITQNDGTDNTLQTSLPSRNLGLSGRTTYNYDNKYFAEFDFGYNGTERFYKNQRFGFFPSVGVAWQISSESFMEKLEDVFSNLKLRGTYGLVGNDAIGAPSDRFFYLSETDPNNTGRGAVFGENNTYSRPGYLISRYSNFNITWEKSYQMNLGLEIGLWNKLNFIGEYYTNDRRDILMTRPDFSTMGLSATNRANVGRARSRGIDLSLDYTENFENDFWVSGRGNFTYTKSKFVVYEEPEYLETYRSRVGYAIDQQWGYIAERLFVDDYEAANSPRQNFGVYGGGDIKYLDVNRDGQITEADQVPIGYPTTPQIVYGVGFSAGFKSLDISAFFQGLAQESFWLNVAAYNSTSNKGSTLPFVSQGAFLQAYADNHWSEENQNAYALWPRLSTTVISNNTQRSTWFMRDGAFLRLKQAEIGYSLPRQWLSRIRSSACRIYINASNLLTFTKFRLWDVEQAGNGFNYPIQRVYNIGFRINFD